VTRTRTVELPPIGDYRNVPVVEVLVRPGDRVAVDDPLIVLESDKATIEVPSPVAGEVLELFVERGTRVSQGTKVLSVVAVEGEATVSPESPPAPVPVAAEASAAAPEPGPRPASAEPASLAPPQSASGAETAGAHATPSVRAFARELAVPLDAVTPSGRNGRILREDVLAFVKGRLAATTAAPASAGGFSVAPMPAGDFSRFGEVERVALTRVQRISGSSLHRNWVTIPHVTSFDEADVTDAEAFRLALNAEPREPKVKLTMVAFLVKAAALALRIHPRFNASLEGDELVLKKYVHVGVAVDTPKGLMVPVLRDCDRKGLIAIGGEIAALAERARDGKLAPSDMEGGCFSVSSLGGIGGTGFTPIINAPEVAILGAARAGTQPRWDGSAFQPRLVMPLSLSWDHRVVDGVAAARFLGTIASILGDFRRAAL